MNTDPAFEERGREKEREEKDNKIETIENYHRMEKEKLLLIRRIEMIG